MPPVQATPSPAEARTVRSAAQLRDGRWVVRQALLGLVLMIGFALGGALLYHASIDPSIAEQTASE